VAGDGRKHVTLPFDGPNLLRALPWGLAILGIVVRGGTASCDLALGYELPDGPYVARAAVELDQPSAPGYFWSQPLPVELGPGT
jgi:hypothetical protein